MLIYLVYSFNNCSLISPVSRCACALTSSYYCTVYSFNNCSLISPVNLITRPPAPHLFLFHPFPGSKMAEQFVKNNSFSSFEEFSAVFDAYKKESCSLFKSLNAVSAAADNKRRNTPIPDNMKYSYVKFGCVHFGHPRPTTSKGTRSKQRFSSSFARMK